MIEMSSSSIVMLLACLVGWYIEWMQNRGNILCGVLSVELHAAHFAIVQLRMACFALILY